VLPFIQEAQPRVFDTLTNKDMTQTLMTSKEKEREKRNSHIRADFARLRAEFPDASNWRIYGELAKRYDLTVMTIRNIMQSVKK
jgi:Mor family transcriptional regulator